MNIYHRIKNKFYKKISYDDRFITRLPSSVIGCGMLHEGNIRLMDYAIRSMPESNYIMEIGSWAGLSTTLLLHLLKKYKRKEVLVGCDPWVYTYDYTISSELLAIDGRPDISMKEYMNFIKQNFVNASLFFNKENLPYTFHLSSDILFKDIRNNTEMTDVFGRSFKWDGKLGFCYIDGNHTFDFVKRDFENADAFLVKGGFILFDDSLDGGIFGSTEFMKYIRNHPRYKVVGKNPNYMIMKIS